MIAIPKRVVVHGLYIPNCPEAIRENGSQTMEVRFMGCDCIADLAPCIAQSADKTFRFEDQATADYSLASEITFDIWQGGIAGSSLYSGSLTGGQITLIADNIFALTITGATSNAFPIGVHYCEAWVTLSGGERRMVGAGRFRVIDTRKHD